MNTWTWWLGAALAAVPSNPVPGLSLEILGATACDGASHLEVAVHNPTSETIFLVPGLHHAGADELLPVRGTTAIAWTPCTSTAACRVDASLEAPPTQWYRGAVAIPPGEHLTRRLAGPFAAEGTHWTATADVTVWARLTEDGIAWPTPLTAQRSFTVRSLGPACREAAP